MWPVKRISQCLSFETVFCVFLVEKNVSLLGDDIFFIENLVNIEVVVIIPDLIRGILAQSSVVATI